MANNNNIRPIGAIDEPNVHGIRTGIRAPVVGNHNFEIKPNLISMVQHNKFHGLPMEDPLDHLDNFECLCETVNMNGVSEDAFKLRLFPFSLGDKARNWLKTMPQGSITTWENCKKQFLSKFFSTSRTARLRNEISSFAQRSNESFHEAWERYKGYLDACPHHGFSQDSILSTWYRGVTPKFRLLLDTASNGNFLSKDATNAMQLVENLAQANGTYGEDYDRSQRGSINSHVDGKVEKDIKTLNEKLDKLLLANQRGLHFVGEQQSGQEIGVDVVGNEEEVAYMGQYGGYNKGYNNQWRGNNNLSYRSNNVENPQDQYYPPMKPQNQGMVPYAPKTNQVTQASSSSSSLSEETKGMFKQIMEGQSKITYDLHQKIDRNYKELSSKFDGLATHVKTLDNQFAQFASSSSKQKGVLPGKSDPNPKDYCNVILESNEEDEDSRKVVEELAKLLYGADYEEIDWEEETRKEKAKERERMAKVSAIETKESCSAKKKMDMKVVVERAMDNGEGLIGALDNKRLEREASTPTQASNGKSSIKRQKVEEVILPKIEKLEVKKEEEIVIPPPFPPRVYTKKEKQAFRLFKDGMEKIGAKTPFDPYISDMPKHMAYIKSLFENKKEVEEMMESIAPMGESKGFKVLKKIKHPGRFAIPCTLGNKDFKDAMCDSGSSVNLISSRLVEELGLKDRMQAPSSTVMFGDMDPKTPIGVLMDYPVMMGSCVIPTDFTVFDWRRAKNYHFHF